MPANPLISVVMPAYNAERFIGEAIESILNQTLKDFEFIVINDGSTDRTEQIILSYKDPRIVYTRNEVNKGLSYSFNRGIEMARGRYLARMDSDDISMPLRFAKQSLFLEKNPTIDIVGSSIITINERGAGLATHQRSRGHKGIKFSSLFSNPMYHPTVMGRLKVFKSHHFNETLSNSEDYELWSRLLFTTQTEFANMSDPLLKYRVFPQSFTQTLDLDKRAVSAHNSIKNMERYLELDEKAESFIVHLRQGMLLPIGEVFTGLIIYLKATVSFGKKEKLSAAEAVEIAGKYLSFAANLFKHEIREIIKRR